MATLRVARLAGGGATLAERFPPGDTGSAYVPLARHNGDAPAGRRRADGEGGERVQRMTRQRAAVAEALDGAADFRSAQQVHEALRTRGEGVGLATVYRTLLALAEAGEVDVLRTADGESLYRRCRERGHHHHLVCRSCGATVEIAADIVEQWAHEVGARHGFTSVTHVAELTGTCAECARRAAEPGVRR